MNDIKVIKVKKLLAEKVQEVEGKERSILAEPSFLLQLGSTLLPSNYMNLSPRWQGWFVRGQSGILLMSCFYTLVSLGPPGLFCLTCMVQLQLHPGEPVHLDVCVRIVVLEEARSGCSRPGCRGLVGKEKGAKMPKSRRPGCRGLGGQDAVGQDAVGQDARG